MGNDKAALATIALTFIIGIFLLGKFVLYTAKPTLSPTYRRLDRYGYMDDVALDIERQLDLETVQYTKKEIVTDDWIIKPGLLQYVLIKNAPDRCTLKNSNFKRLFL